MNKIWLRFAPIVGVLLVNIAWMLDWIDQSTWGILLALMIGAYVILSFWLFPQRREIFSANRQQSSNTPDSDQSPDQ